MPLKETTMTTRFAYGADAFQFIAGYARTRLQAVQRAEALQQQNRNWGTVYILDRLARRGRPNRWQKPLDGPWQIMGYKPAAADHGMHP
jgi:hypothetical protein